MNNIAITWSSDQKQLIADMQRRQVLLENEIARLQQLAGMGKASGTAITNSYREANKELDRLGRIADTAFKKPVSAMDAHLARMKELRVLYRMGKIDAEQFNQAATASRKQRLTEDGFAASLKERKRLLADIAAMQERQLAAERAAAAKSLQEQKTAALALALQKATALHETEQSERSAAAKLLAEQKAAADSLRLQKLTAIHEAEQAERSAAAKALQEQKAAALSLALQKATAIDDEQRAQQEANQSLRLQKLTAIDENQRAEKQAADSLRLQKFTEIEQERRARQDATQSLRLQKLTAIHEEQQAQKLAAEQIRRGLMSQRDVARQNYAERMRQIKELHAAGLLSQTEFNAAAKQAQQTLEQSSKIDMSKMWVNVPGQIRTALTMTAALATAIRLAREEFENLKQQQKESATTTMTFAQAEEQAQQSLDETLTPDQLYNMILEGATKKTLSPVQLMRAANSALASRGEGVTSKQAVEASIELGEFTRLNPDQSGDFTAAVLAMKASRPDATLKGLAGQLQQAKISSKVASLGAFSHYAVPVAVAARAYGDTESEAFGIYSALGGATNDVAGRVSASGTVDLEKDLQILSSGVESGAIGGQKIKGGLGKNTLERLRAIAFDKRFKGVKERLLGENEDPEIAELYRKAGRMTVESRNYGAIRLLYQGDDLAWANLRKKVGEQIEPGAAAERLVDQQLKGFESTPSQITARTESKMMAGGEILDLRNQGAAHGSISREAIQNLLRKSGVSNVEQILQGMRFEIGSDGGQSMPISQAHKILSEYAESKLNPNPVQLGGEYGPEAAMKRFAEWITGTERRKREPTELEMQQAVVLQQMVNELKRIADQETPQVNVTLPGAGDKPAPPAAAGLGAP